MAKHYLLVNNRGKDQEFSGILRIVITATQQSVQNGSFSNKSAIKLRSSLDILEYLFFSYHIRLSGYLLLVLAK